MIEFFSTTFLTHLTYINTAVLPINLYLPFIIYLSSIFWILTLILQDTTSTRINNQTTLFRSNLSTVLLNLYKL